MIYFSFSMMILLLCLKQSVLSITVRKFVYQKDMSEYCKRRVVPSVFLGRHVVEAHSQILHFSKMELPYSCFISVRAESGSNVVLVVQLLSDKSLVNACAESPSQLLVYEMGETFGGYWGPLPDSVVRPEPTQPEVYTRRTTQTNFKQKIPISYVENTSKKPKSTTADNLNQVRENEGDFIRVEVPIVNFSGKFISEGNMVQDAFDVDEIFDLLYDVTPGSKQQYKTSILPVVHISIANQNGGRRGEGARYNLDLDYESVGKYTKDTRLPFPYYSERTTKRKTYGTNFYVNRLLNFKKTRTSHRPTEHTSQYFRKNKYASSASPTSSLDLDKVNTLSDADLYKSPITASIENVKTWEKIDEILRKLNDSSSNIDDYDNGSKNMTRLLDTISNLKHNRSVYLLPHWASFVGQTQRQQVNSVTKRFSSFTRKAMDSFNYASKNIKEFFKSSKTSTLLISTSDTTTERDIKFSTIKEESSSTNDYKQTIGSSSKNNITVKDFEEVSSIATETIIVTNQSQSNTAETISENVTQKTNRKSVSLVEIKPTPSTMSSHPDSKVAITGSMVDHESWENVVQAASVMAELLNQTQIASDKLGNYTSLGNSTTQDANDTIFKHNGIRLKRKIQPIPIENARPHNLTTREVIATTYASSFGISDMQEFAQLVELQDDELHERVALRYLRQYTGPLLFNICDYGEPNTRHVYLFNSSRVVLAIHNFTLERMTVMLTPARTLLSGAARCGADTLECQVYGTRICIDSLNACDGVPNCGAYDIYDEDRLMCGAAAGLQHNVYLAAITFLAVLLTMMYIVHYWLRRCVPKVSKAFFIYTDGAENILYLESIMRSPHDMYDTPKMTYNAHLFDDVDYMGPESEKSRQNIFHRLIRACFNCCKCKSKEKILFEEILDESFMGPKKIYSFAELELSKIVHKKKVTEVGVQTGNSLEIPRAELKKPVPAVELKSLPERSIDNRRLAKVAVASDDDLHKHVNELNVIKFFKEFKYEQGQSASRATVTSAACETEGKLKLVEKQSFEEEEELQTHFYDHHAHEKPGPSHRVITTTCDIHSEKLNKPKQAKKHLRFEEETTTIPTIFEEDDDEDDDELKHDSVDRKKKDHDADDTGGRDFKRFWKGKKSKKKAHLALH